MVNVPEKCKNKSYVPNANKFLNSIGEEAFQEAERLQNMDNQAVHGGLVALAAKLNMDLVVCVCLCVCVRVCVFACMCVGVCL